MRQQLLNTVGKRERDKMIETHDADRERKRGRHREREKKKEKQRNDICVSYSI